MSVVHPRTHATGHAVLGLIALLLTSCGQSESTVQVLSVRELGPLVFSDVIRGRDGGYSARFRGACVFTFGDTVLERAGSDGERWRSSTWCQTRDLDASDGLEGLIEPLDEAGAPGEFLPFAAEELAFNHVHNRSELGEKRQRFALWPGPMVVHPSTGEALVFYGKLLCGAGAWDFQLVGHSLARWPHPEAPCERPAVRPQGVEPTLLFLKDDILLGQGALATEEWIYAYGVRTQGLRWPCVLARVRWEDALERERWQYFAGESGWVSDASAATEIMQAAPQLSVHFNPHLSVYLAIYGAPLENGIRLRTAPTPQGPWSEAQQIHVGMAPIGEDQWNYCALAHGELQRGGGRFEYLTYYRTTGFLKGEVRLVEVELGRR